MSCAVWFCVSGTTGLLVTVVEESRRSKIALALSMTSIAGLAGLEVNALGRPPMRPRKPEDDRRSDVIRCVIPFPISCRNVFSIVQMHRGAWHCALQPAASTSYSGIAWIARTYIATWAYSKPLW
ncbi:hypothetical protein PLICRDRAFT_244484 [Plicaturopsis crispa FD-325 SS-3]|nr:hypothetical protein PLICRDRAFT_244484 [Plicaturopsis crispa FD-325 SS-3]